MVNEYMPIFKKSLANLKSPLDPLLKSQKVEKQPITNIKT